MMAQYDVIDTVRTTGIGTAGVTYSILGMPFSDIAALATAIYIILKIVLVVPDIITKYRKKKK